MYLCFAYICGYNQIHQRTVAIDTSFSFLMQYLEIKLMYFQTFSWLCFLHIDKKIGTSLVLDVVGLNTAFFFIYLVLRY